MEMGFLFWIEFVTFFSIILYLILRLTKTFKRQTTTNPFRLVQTDDEFSKIVKHSKPLTGPYCFPFFGYLPIFFTKRKPYQLLSDLCETYGNVFKIKIGRRTLVIVNKLTILQDAFKRKSFTGRPDFLSFRGFTEGGNFHRMGLMSSTNPEYRFLRKNGAKAISMLAQSKDAGLQRMVGEGWLSFQEDIEKHINRPFDFKHDALQVTGAIVGSITFGLQFDRNHPLLKTLVAHTDRMSSFFKFALLTDYFNLPNFVVDWQVRRQRACFRPLEDMIESHIQSHQCNESVVDLADAFDIISKECPESTLQVLNVDRSIIRNQSQEMFMGGFISIQQTFIWIMCFMAKYRRVQDKVAEELLTKIGSDRFPSPDDMDRCPYTQAATLEVQRCDSFLPFLTAHQTLADETLDGFWIPKGTVILPNMWHMNNDPTVFEEPQKFYPERFINPDGTLNVEMYEKVIPFSYGKRRCIGEQLAKHQLFMLMASTLLKYTVEPAEGESVDMNNVTEGLFRVINPCRMVFRYRKIDTN